MNKQEFRHFTVLNWVYETEKYNTKQSWGQRNSTADRAFEQVWRAKLCAKQTADPTQLKFDLEYPMWSVKPASLDF